MTLKSSTVYNLILQLKELENDNFVGFDFVSTSTLLYDLRNLEKSYRIYQETQNVMKIRGENINEEIDLEVSLLPIDDIKAPIKYAETLDIIRRLYDTNE